MKQSPQPLSRIHWYRYYIAKTVTPPILLRLLELDAQIDGLMQERCNSSALAMELRISCINPSKWRSRTSHTLCHYVNFAMRWGTASNWASRRRTTPKWGSYWSGRWMGHLLSYSLSGGHNGAMLPINLGGLNGPLTSHFIFSSHINFSLNTPTHYSSPMQK